MFEGVAKLCQRQIYSWLSSKCGLPVCIVGLLIAIISAFQFGEVSLSFYLKHTTFQCKADKCAADGISWNNQSINHVAPEIRITVRAQVEKGLGLGK